MLLAQISKKKIILNILYHPWWKKVLYEKWNGTQTKPNNTQSKTLQNNKCLGKGSGSAFMYYTWTLRQFCADGACGCPARVLHIVGPTIHHPLSNQCWFCGLCWRCSLLLLCKGWSISYCSNSKLSAVEK